MLHSRSSLRSDIKYTNYGEQEIRETARDHKIPTNMHIVRNRINSNFSLCFFPHIVAMELRIVMPPSTRNARHRSSRRPGRSPCKSIFNFAWLRSYIVSSGSSQSCGSAPETRRNECAVPRYFRFTNLVSPSRPSCITGSIDIFLVNCKNTAFNFAPIFLSRVVP